MQKVLEKLTDSMSIKAGSKGMKDTRFGPSVHAKCKNKNMEEHIYLPLAVQLHPVH